MFIHKSCFIVLLLTQTSALFSIDFASTTTEVNGFFMNLSQADKMNLIVGSLDNALYTVYSNFQSNQNTEILQASINAGLATYTAMLFTINPNMHKNIMYLYFLEYSYYLCKYGKTAEFLATLSLEARTTLINLSFQYWLADYTSHLNINSFYMLNAVNARFV